MINSRKGYTVRIHFTRKITAAQKQNQWLLLTKSVDLSSNGRESKARKTDQTDEQQA